jgi:hypothetical protein
MQLHLTTNPPFSNQIELILYVRAPFYIAFCPRLRLSAGLPAWLPVGTYSYITLPQGLTRILPPCSFPSVIELASLSTAMPPLGQLGSPSRPTLDPSQTTYLIPAPNHPPCSANSALPDPRTRNTSSPQISHSSASQSRDRNAQKPCQTC